MSTEANKALIRRFVEEVQGKGNLAVIDEIFARDYADHGFGNAEVSDLEAAKKFLGMAVAAFPDMTVTIHDQVAEGDKVVTRKTLTGTHQGAFMGVPATGRRVSMYVIDIFRVVNGKIVEHWASMDRLDIMQQIGVIPPPAQGR